MSLKCLCIYTFVPKFNIMGKGDKRSKKGKIVRGTFGKSRPKKVKTRYEDKKSS